MKKIFWITMVASIILTTAVYAKPMVVNQSMRLCKSPANLNNPVQQMEAGDIVDADMDIRVFKSGAYWVSVTTAENNEGYLPERFLEECEETEARIDNRHVILEDQADLLTASEEGLLRTTATLLSERTGWTVDLVTTDDAGGKEAQQYAEDFYMANFVQDDGVACLIDMDNREIYIATSGNAIYCVTDVLLNKILDDAFESVSQGDYSGTFGAMLKGLSEAYTIATERTSDTSKNEQDTDDFENRVSELEKQVAELTHEVALLREAVEAGDYRNGVAMVEKPMIHSCSHLEYI